MKRVAIGVLVAVGVALGATVAVASGQWSTYIRPTVMTDVEAGADSVWIASSDGGLILYDRRTGMVTPFFHQVGGLSSNSIASVALDRSRRLWVGTLGRGLSRLAPDGTWSLVNTFDGLPSDRVTVVKAYGDSVWIGTDSGLAFWNGQEISGRLPDGVNPSPFASDDIRGIAMIGDSVWVATGAGVYLGRMSDQLRTWPAVNAGLVGSDIKGLAAAGGKVFALTVATVFTFNSGTWAPLFGPGNVYRITDHHGVLLACTDTGLWRWTGSAWVREDAALISSQGGTGQAVLAAADDGTGQIFGGQNGAVLIPAGSGAHTSIAVPGPIDNYLVNVVSDGRGAYYATRGLGSGWLRDGAWTNYDARNCLTCSSDVPQYVGDVAAMLVDGSNRKWFWAWGGAVEILDDNASPPVWTHLWNDPYATEYQVKSHRWGWSTAVDQSGGVWVGGDSPCITLDCGYPSTPRGIDYYDHTGAYTANYQRDSTEGMLGDQVRGLVVDRYNVLWAGFSTSIGTGGVAEATIPTVPGGALTFRDLTKLRDLNSSTALNVFGIARYGQDSVWVLSEDSLRLVRAGTVTPYEKLGPVAEPLAPHPLEVTPDGSVWTAADGGVRVFHPGGAVEDFTVDNSPLANSRVHSIRSEPGSNAVWFATEGGLNRYDPYYVAPPPPRLSHLTVHVFPNPVSLSALGFELRLTGEGTSYVGAVFGIDGRKLRTIAVEGNGALAWDGRDDDGVLVRPGVYFVQVAAGGRTATTRVVVLR